MRRARVRGVSVFVAAAAAVVSAPSAAAAYTSLATGGQCRGHSARCSAASVTSRPISSILSVSPSSRTSLLESGARRRTTLAPAPVAPAAPLRMTSEDQQPGDGEPFPQQQEMPASSGGGGISPGSPSSRLPGAGDGLSARSAAKLLRRAGGAARNRIRKRLRGRQRTVDRSIDARLERGEKELSTSSVASYRSIMAFVSTTVLIWLSEPLLSLVDTTIVGRFASASGAAAGASSGSSAAVIALASLGPATLLTDNALYLTYFLSIATTNKLAPALARKDWDGMVRTTSHVLGVAAVLGAAITALISTSGSHILASILGDAASADAAGEVLSSALSYARIRGYVAPLAVMDCVAQSVCLATLDMKTPALAVIAASLTNIIGDWLLVVKMGMGVKGAALATAAATTVSAGMLLKEVRRKVWRWREVSWGTSDSMNGDDVNGHEVNGNRNSKLNGDTKHRMKAKVNEKRIVLPDGLGVMGSKATKEALLKEGVPLNSTVTTTEGMPSDLSPLPNHPPFVSLPDRSSLISLVSLAGPIFFVMLGKIACYSALTLRATDFGVTALASHNVLLRVFFFYATFGDAFSQAAQSFFPAALVKDRELDESREKGGGTNATEGVESGNRAVRTLLGRMLLLSTIISVLNSHIGQVIVKNCGAHIAGDPGVSSLLSSNACFFELSLLLHPAIMLFEGTIIAKRDLGYLASTYGVTLLGLVGLLKYGCGGFGDVWRALFLFQAMRLLQFGGRVGRKTMGRSARSPTP
eukprot:CAMPEP_0113530048 /NCGR_PEP_ID=MMETSP0015_2-20120614/2724_1 /TAXON_ID=2838 /ORGANISM="Odontella" /LENGTH=755 /DNA_ID=CAMNT_0000428729 /DNA_START=189 /DNA_END=2456 /DNA_ORIENTATION=+ /assembly_acc=CAM_ASM_000160